MTGKLGAGGIAVTNRTNGTISNSYSTGAITGNGQAGGLVGYNYATAQINNSYATGTVTNPGIAVAGGTATGGLVGDNRGLIANGYATGAVNGNNAVGGVVGAMSSTGASLTNVYSSGAVAVIASGAGVVGGVVGTMSGTSTVNRGYFNATQNPTLAGVGVNTGSGAVTSVTGLTSAQMQTGSSFTNFNYTTTTGLTGNNWVMVDTDGTLNNSGGALGATGPMLSSEHSSTIKSAHQLQLMAMNLAGNYTFGKDINAAATGATGDVWNGGSFIPVGTDTSAPFTGTLDGAGHVVSGLIINRPTTNFNGLFGATSGTAIVRDIGLEGGSITGKNATGALVGNNLGLVSGSYSTASVTGGTQVGGLAGANGIGGTVTNSYASGAVAGTGVIGGLAGLNSGTLTNNHASGAVTGGSSPGGLVGSNGGSASGNFWDTTTSGQLSSATGTGLSTAQMKSLATYSGASWDLAGAWIVYDSYAYPLLRAFMTPLQVTFASNASKTYDGTNSWTAPDYTFSNPNVSLSGSLNYGAAGNAVNAGTYAITAGGLYSGQHGYAITSNSATLTINKLGVTLSGASVASRAYDGTTAASLLGGTLNGVLSQDNVNIAYNTGTFDTKDAGTGKTVTALLTGSASGNYAVTASGLTGAITTKLLTWSGLTAANKVYDGTKAATITGGSLNGMVGSETVTWVPSGLFSDSNAANGKTVTVSTVLGDGSNGGLAAWRPTTGSPIRSRRPTSRKKC